MLSQKKQFEVDELVNLIEKIVDVRFKMLIEQQYNNYRQYLKIVESEYDPLIEQLKLNIEKIVIDISEKR